MQLESLETPYVASREAHPGASLLKQTRKHTVVCRHKHNRILVAAAILWPIVFTAACGAPSSSTGWTIPAAELKIDDQGYLSLPTGLSLPLAGVRFRPASESGEPQPGEVLCRIVRSIGKPVRVIPDPIGVCLVARYSQPIWYRFEPLAVPIMPLRQKHGDRTLNELAVAMGLADEYLPGTWDEALACDVHTAQINYWMALHRKEWVPTMEQILENPQIMYRFSEGFRSRLAPGDLQRAAAASAPVGR